LKKFLFVILVLPLLAFAGLYYWADQPVTAAGAPAVEFTIKPGSGVRGTAQQIAAAGIPLQPMLFEIVARASGKSAKFKAGTYELKPGTTPRRLIDQLVRGEFAQESLVIIEGWTFRQMRQAVDGHKSLKHDTAGLSEAQLLAKIGADVKKAEGMFYPDTYLFAKNSSDVQIYKQAYGQMSKRLADAWAARDPSLPYKTPYEALTMASIIEKETGQKSEREMIAAVFINRLRIGMLLQTDPTVIYGMGEQFDGNIRKRDLQTDTPYNTYTRAGLPPTPIALPGAGSLAAAFHPAAIDALYFVSRGDGTSHFSSNLNEHNNAVNKYQR
jgi:UPF0755 protein